MASNPIELIIADRAEARRRSDPNADLCFLAIADADGRASVRTLVLRGIEDAAIMLFINRSSPKWRVLEAGASYEALLYYPSMSRQYRLAGASVRDDPGEVRRHWHRRPTPAKYLDMLYEHVRPQSSTLPDRATLTTELARLRDEYPEDRLDTPAGALCIVLSLESVDRLDLSSEDRIHDRRRFDRSDEQWRESVLVP